MNRRVIVALVVLVALGIGAFLYVQNRAVTPPEAELVAEEQPAGLGAQIYAQAQNPTKDQFPESNPFAADTNPFDARTNPYEDTYRNPFE